MRLAWGDIEEPASFYKSTYPNTPIGKKYPMVIANNDTDARNLNKEDDIVQLNWPSGWYIPTAKDFDELRKNTTITKETIDRHNWFRLTGKTEIAYLYLPQAILTMLIIRKNGSQMHICRVVL